MTRAEYKHYSHLYRNADRLRSQAERYYQTSCAKYWLAQQVGFSAILPKGTRRVLSASGIASHIADSELQSDLAWRHGAK